MTEHHYTIDELYELQRRLPQSCVVRNITAVKAAAEAFTPALHLPHSWKQLEECLPAEAKALRYGEIQAALHLSGRAWLPKWQGYGDEAEVVSHFLAELASLLEQNVHNTSKRELKLALGIPMTRVVELLRLLKADWDYKDRRWRLTV
jgi:hypothetical protein